MDGVIAIPQENSIHHLRRVRRYWTNVTITSCTLIGLSQRTSSTCMFIAFGNSGNGAAN